MKTALVHDDLAQAGGAERVVAALHQIFPGAPLYTSLYDRRSTLPCFAGMDVRTSFLQGWPIATRRLHKLALAHYPTAFEQFDLGGYDLVVSSCSRFARGSSPAPRRAISATAIRPPVSPGVSTNIWRRAGRPALAADARHAARAAGLGR